MPRSRKAVGLLALATLLAAGALGGCQLFGFVAAAQADLPKTVKPEYTDLTGKSFAVFVSANRATQADFARVPPELTTRITEHLVRENAKVMATHYIPPVDIISKFAEQPRLLYLTKGELMAELEVDRLIFVELDEFRLIEPGNSYVWDGAATGRVQVYEKESPLPDDPSYEKTISVRFPDKPGYTEAEIPPQNVASVLVSRFSNRASWLFYEHKEDPRAGYE